MSEILEPGTRTVDNSLRLRIHAGQGYREILRGDVLIASDSEAVWARAAKFAAEIIRRAVQAPNVAVLGGGFCLLPQLLGRELVTVYELEPALARFAGDATFVPGDWRATLPPVGIYDVIVLDTGEAVSREDRAILAAALASGGLLLGVE